MPRHPAIGQPAPSFELTAPGRDDIERWSLDDHVGHGRVGHGHVGHGHPVVLVFHRHIH